MPAALVPAAKGWDGERQNEVVLPYYQLRLTRGGRRRNAALPCCVRAKPVVLEMAHTIAPGERLEADAASPAELSHFVRQVVLDTGYLGRTEVEQCHASRKRRYRCPGEGEHDQAPGLRLPGGLP